MNPKDSLVTVLPRDVLSFFGAHDLNNLYETGRFALSPADIILHEKWNPSTSQYDSDLSLLRFEENSILFNNFVQPICLWDPKIEYPVTDGLVTGWGQSEDVSKKHENKPKVIIVSVHSNEDCLPGEKELAALSSRTTFCAGHGNGSGVCFGDSGGSLFVKINNIFYLKGIVSSSLTTENGCDISKNAVYTNVPKFDSWINDHVHGGETFCFNSYIFNVCFYSIQTFFLHLRSRLLILSQKEFGIMCCQTEHGK